MASDLKKVYEQRKKKYYQMKENGLCPTCGKPVDDGHTICEECRAERRKDYNWYVEHGICPRCHEDAAPGKVLCAVCALKHSEMKKAKYDSLTEEELAAQHKKHNERIAESRRKKKERGICHDCNKPVFDGRSLCLDCLLKKKKRDEGRHRKYDYKDPNGCYRCGAPCVPGKKLCPKHYKINLGNMKKAIESEGYKLSQEKHRENIHAMWEEIKWEKR